MPLLTHWKCYEELVQKTKKRRGRPQVDGHSRYKGAEKTVMVNGVRNSKFS
jgi:hypothetical protein